MSYNRKDFENTLDSIRKLSTDAFWYDRSCLRSYQLDERSFVEHQEDIASQGDDMAEIIKIRWDDFLAGIRNVQEHGFNAYPKAYNKSLWGDHDGCYSIVTNKSDRNVQREKNIEKAIYNLSYCGRDILRDYRGLTRDLGRIMDYEIPVNLESSRNIDLISVKSNRLYILELKKCRSKETLLRCILEAYTYSRLIDRNRLKESFGMSQDDALVVCPLVFDDSAAFMELQHIYKNKINEQKSKLIALVRHIEKTDKDIQIKFSAINSATAKQKLLATPDVDGKPFDPSWLE